MQKVLIFLNLSQIVTHLESFPTRNPETRESIKCELITFSWPNGTGGAGATNSKHFPCAFHPPRKSRKSPPLKVLVQSQRARKHKHHWRRALFKGISRIKFLCAEAKIHYSLSSAIFGRACTQNWDDDDIKYWHILVAAAGAKNASKTGK
jgi:hypothetical protein